MSEHRFHHRQSEEERRAARETQELETSLIQRWLNYARSVLANDNDRDDDPSPSAA